MRRWYHAEVVLGSGAFTETKRIRALITLAILLSAAYSLWLSWQFEFNNVDDAYIAFRYGQNLMQGHGLVFNPGEHVEGYTSPLWTVLLAPFTTLEPDIVWFSIGLGLVASVVALWGLYAHVRFLIGAGAGAALAWAVPLVAADNTYAFWAIGGMETPLFTALVLWSSYAALVARSRRAALGAGLLLGVTTLTRPEGALIAACAIAHRLFLAGRPRAEAVALGAGFSLVVAPHLGFRYAFYGSLLPNTFHNKVGLGLASAAAGGRYLWSFLRWRYFLPLLALAPVLCRERRSAVSLHGLIAASYLAYIVAVGGDWPVANRFFAPVLPFLYLLLLLGLEAVRPQLLRYTALTLCLLLGGWSTYRYADVDGLVRRNDNVEVETQRKRFGIWLRQHVGPDTVIATRPSGAIPYYSRLETIDMLGMTDAHIARAPRRGFRPGHDRSDPSYVLARHPEIIVGSVGFEGVPPGYRCVNLALPEAVRPREIVFVRAPP